LTILHVRELEHPLVLPYRDLPANNTARRRSGHFIVEGRRLVKRLLAAGIRPSSLLIEERLLDEVAAQLAPTIAPDIPVCLASRQLLSQIVGFPFHRGMLACAPRPAERGLADFLSGLPAVATVVACSGVQEADNLGGIFRSSAALGVDFVLLGNHCADPLGRRVLRVSSGSVFRLPFCESHDLAGDLRRLRSDEEFTLTAAVLGAEATPLDRFQRPRRLVLVLGNEAEGLSADLVAGCDRRITIPMRPGIDSLNVSVAAGILLYRLRPQGSAGQLSQ
jgi:tRNA G18 (ribose-2'-O)-methylase SpoU